MPKDIEQLLSRVGLLPSESKVYLSTLELGPSTVQNIAGKARISRTAAYEAIELLQKRIATYCWWRDMRQVIVSSDDGSLIRLCGIHHSDPFAAWANARILYRFRRRLAAHLKVPTSTIPGFSGLRVV